MNQRSGTTLTEVLVAIFIMAIGLMAVMTLFPVGALSMAQALRDDRAAQAAQNAAAVAEARNVRHDPLVNNWFQRMAKPSKVDPFSMTKDNPGYDGPSLPVFVDPIGAVLDPGSLNPTLGGQPFGIPRTNITYKVNRAGTWVDTPLDSQHAYEWFSLLDDLTYLSPASNPAYGVPTNNPQTDPVQREGRYTWAYMLQRPRLTDPEVVSVTVVVYNARSQQVPLEPAGNVFTKVVFDRSVTQVLVPYAYAGKAKPNIRKGDWILDATMGYQGPKGFIYEPHGYFYRVVSVADAVDANKQPALLLDLPAPPRASTKGDAYSVLIFMENALEVFEKGPGWQP
jgi:prepilin-type N-terminal cleavage/methylation domain-containing protein